jgi:hypothetical protein
VRRQVLLEDAALDLLLLGELLEELAVHGRRQRVLLALAQRAAVVVYLHVVVEDVQVDVEADRKEVGVQLDLGFGRTVASEKEAPTTLANRV